MSPEISKFEIRSKEEIDFETAHAQGTGVSAREAAGIKVDHAELTDPAKLLRAGHYEALGRIMASRTVSKPHLGNPKNFGPRTTASHPRLSHLERRKT